MGSLLNDWIQLFDEKNFENLKEESQPLRAITMLYITIKKEFQKVEIALGNELQTYKQSLEAKHCKDVKKEQVEDDIISVPSSPEKCFKNSSSNISKNTKILLKSPTFDRHRKANFKKMRKPLCASNISGVFPLKNNDMFTSGKKNLSSKVIVNASDDDDMFDSSVIGATPEVDISKRTKNTIHTQRKKIHLKRNLSGTSSTTLTQIFSGMISKDNDEKDDTTMMDIDEILEKVENAENIDESVNKFKNISASKNLKVHDSFVEDYDKIPEPKAEPSNPFVYKETVRGNEKKKLKGWSCKDCEHFYKGMNLSDKELEKKMNECSKHKSKFKPDEDTIPGYWDLSIPSTPEDEKSTPPDSPQGSQNLNESTIFCFYKK
ncbi:uncharacterized protein LOC123313813 [Coccinella septempunctata]|uniref:uncharacterized protein LOC123313813 n=1 Tax=Coccinella septempunctata TaxID=41139 RepID=UPI001D063A05|nr:uncharacterized protein LOC123313813 [Coccinella septempunctata]